MKKYIPLVIALFLAITPNLVLAEGLEFYPGGHYFSSDTQNGQAAYATGRYLWKASDEFEVGGFAFATLGSGGEAEGNPGYEYNYHQFAFGPSLRYYGYGWDVVGEAGPWWASTEGDEGQFENKQDDFGLYIDSNLSMYGRRQSRKIWFAETKLWLSANLVFDCDNERTQDGIKLSESPYDAERVGGRLTSAIYDFELSNSFRLSPLVQAGLEYRDDRTFWEGGGGVEIAWNTWQKVALTIRYKEDPDNTDDRVYFQLMGNFDF